MKTTLSLLVLLAAIGQGIAQGTVPPGMAHVPYAHLSYDYWADKKQGIEVNDFYAAQYLESNFQYRRYLDCLSGWGLDSALQAAQPNPDVWDIPSLTAEEQAELKQHYWVAAEFGHYPVLGLTPAQINAYLEWKTDMLKQAKWELSNSGEKSGSGEGRPLSAANIPRHLGSEERLKMSASKSFKHFPGFRLPTFHALMAALPTAGRRVPEKTSPDKRLLAWLKRHPEFDFLDYAPPKTALATQAIREKLDALGIRPVAASDLKKLKKRKDSTNLPLLVIEQRLPSEYYAEGFISFSSDAELREREKDPSFNPQKLRVIVLQPERMATVAWAADGGRLAMLSISTAGERRLFGFRAVMTKPD